MNDCHYWNDSERGKMKVLQRIPVAVPLHPPQIASGQAWLTGQLTILTMMLYCIASNGGMALNKQLERV